MTADEPTISKRTENSTAYSSPAPDTRQELQERIAQTRQELGDTVEGLVAKADLKARAQGKAGQVRARIGEQASDVKEQASRQAVQINDGARKVTGKLRQTAAAQPPARQRSAAALAAVGAFAAGAWLVQRERRRRSRTRGQWDWTFHWRLARRTRRGNGIPGADLSPVLPRAHTQKTRKYRSPRPTAK
ncbi:MAG TPA: DUF3618 domain-containing protein [Streptosporangiaceae bacterium]|nr:DUF3618 domain-containing protein [Streptosporangiaceae bacterium]